MLQALTKHKIPHDIRNQVWNLEDAKTSSIIGSLLHLPTDLFWNIMREAAEHTDGFSHQLPIAGETGEIIDVEFWPYWTLEDKVEPDVFVRFEKFDLIIELKVHDYNQQTSWQWKREFAAYRKHFPNIEKPVFLIAISGKTDERMANVFQCSWQSVLEATLDVQYSYTSSEPYNNVCRIFDDILKAFSFHKEYRFKYLDSVNISNLSISFDYNQFPSLI